MDIFERASRWKLRFLSSVGSLTTEDLWDLPLISRTAAGPSLESVAKTVNRELKSLDEESFVEEHTDPKRDIVELQLEIIKHVIAMKIEIKKAAEAAVETAQRKRKLLGALARKEDTELESMSREQIEAEIAKL